METIEKPALLFNAIEKGDIVISNGALILAGGPSIRLDDIINLDIYAPREEVAQVVTVGGNTPTIVADKEYALRISVPLQRNQGWMRADRIFKVQSSATISSQADERERIYTQLATQINNHTELPVTAVANGGTSLVLTDNDGYFRTGRKGASEIRPVAGRTGGGFVDADVSITTEPVYSAGIGSDLIAKAPGVDPMIGNAYKGDLNNAVFKNAVGNQNYHSFVIESLVNTASDIRDNAMIKRFVQIILIDDGTGANTDNAAAFAEVLEQFERAAFHKRKTDKLSLQLFGDEHAINSGPDGGSLGTTGNNYGLVGGQVVTLAQLGTNTSQAVLDQEANGGYNIDGDATDGEGVEINLGVGASAPVAIAGKNGAFVRAEFTLADVTDGQVLVGFRKRAASNADYSAYTDYAVIGNVGGGENIDSAANLNDGTDFLVEEIGAVIADTEKFSLQVTLHPDGSVRGMCGNVAVDILSAAGTKMKFDAGDELIPFVHVVNVGGEAPGSVLNKLLIGSGAHDRSMGGFQRGE